ncbi:hypothetical protein KQI84_09930 [bacterium]|nr:hypothetical protein [bacterium]
MNHDAKPEKPDAVSEGWKRKLKRGWILGGVMAIVVGAILGWQFLLKPHLAYPWKPCQENLSKIDSAVQQYILEYGLKDQEEFVALFGTEQPDWSPVLVGKDLYLRYPPKCSAQPHPRWWQFWHWGEKLNDYFIAPNYDWPAPVYCNSGQPGHTFPMLSDAHPD